MDKDYAGLAEGELESHLAEVVSVECLECKDIRARDPGWASGCLDCKDGRRWLLRVDCPCIEWLKRRESSFIMCLPCGGCDHEHNDNDVEECIWCGGLGYVFGGSVWEAIRALGWQLLVETFSVGDEVSLYANYCGHDEIASLSFEENLRADHAIKVALARAWEGKHASS